LKELVMLKVTFGPRSSILPVELSRLTTLVSFEARYGSITGFFPFWNASGLVRLDVEECQLTGSIPPHELGRMTGLTWLNMYGNELTNTIPTEIGLLTDLEMLLLSENRLNGTLPTEIGMCRALSTLAVIKNDLSGTVPDNALGQLTKLTDLTLHGNRFSGSIPLASSSGLCALRRSGTLTSLYVDCSETSCDPSCCYCGR
jgi:Leucine-rich repeat (LRR) protein